MQFQIEHSEGFDCQLFRQSKQWDVKVELPFRTNLGANDIKGDGRLSSKFLVDQILRLMTYEEADKQFKNREFETAFESFSKIAEDELLDVAVRANAYTMMGNVIRGFVDLDSEDDTGVKYYRKAFELDNTDVALLLNIVYSFGCGVGLHQDEKLFNTVYDMLKQSYWAELGNDDRTAIEKIRFEYFESPPDKS